MQIFVFFFLDVLLMKIDEKLLKERLFFRQQRHTHQNLYSPVELDYNVKSVSHTKKRTERAVQWQNTSIRRRREKTTTAKFMIKSTVNILVTDVKKTIRPRIEVSINQLSRSRSNNSIDCVKNIIFTIFKIIKNEKKIECYKFLMNHFVLEKEEGKITHVFKNINIII